MRQNAPPNSPVILKGALVTFHAPNPLPQVIAFQYNPATLTRTLEGQTAGEGGGPEALRLSGAPVETIKLEVSIDATDQLEVGEGVEDGIHPQLANLELLLYPSSARVIANTALMAVGTIEVIPPDGPFTLFVWGPKRILPVTLTEFAVTEEEYDTTLNPIRAKVSLGLRVLSYNDLPITHPGYYLFLAHQIGKEVLAVGAQSNTLESVLGSNVRLL
jgi:hypothetical protein